MGTLMMIIEVGREEKLPILRYHRLFTVSAESTADIS
jgi:hypothetical protein